MNSTMPTSSLANSIGTYGYIVTFSLGLIGHSCSLLTFSQRQLRVTSTALLFLAITISDMFYLFMSVYDFLLISLSLPQLSPYYISLCRFRTFIINCAQTTSAWLLICVGFDRLIRARLPYRTRQWCTRKNAIIALCITIIGSVAFNSHVLLPNFTTVFPFIRVICGPSLLNDTDYSNFYYFAWPVLQICINILAPASLMIVTLFIIYEKVRNAAAAAVRQNQQLQNQMLLLMLSTTILFLVCTLPFGVYRVVTNILLDRNNTREYQIFLVVTALLTILLNANFSIAFYIHCLTSSLFRKTFVKTIKNCVKRRHLQRQNAVQPVVQNTNIAATVRMIT